MTRASSTRAVTDHGQVVAHDARAEVGRVQGKQKADGNAAPYGFSRLCVGVPWDGYHNRGKAPWWPATKGVLPDGGTGTNHPRTADFSGATVKGGLIGPGRIFPGRGRVPRDRKLMGRCDVLRGEKGGPACAAQWQTRSTSESRRSRRLKSECL